jgi:hypothetical protein
MVAEQEEPEALVDKAQAAQVVAALVTQFLQEGMVAEEVVSKLMVVAAVAEAVMVPMVTPALLIKQVALAVLIKGAMVVRGLMPLLPLLAVL